MRFWTWFVAAAGVGLGFAPAPTRQNPAALYFKADARGQSCGRCHTPDGAEFRLVRFDVSDIIRRARQHLSPVEADSIGLYLVKDQVRNGLDPKIAPYQPGGEVLAGKTASERDEGLGKELSKKLPLLMGAPIRSLSSALAVRDEVLNIDPRDVKVGIQMSRISEDIFHGADHASLADWFPDVPVPETPAFLAAREAYRTDPSPLQSLDPYDFA